MRRQARRGFTLIELLVVIGIIMVLVALLVYGYRAMNRTIGGKETHTELKVCKGMLAEYEGRNQLQGIEFFYTGAMPQPTDPGASTAGTQQFPVYPDPFMFPAPLPSEYTWVNGGAQTPPAPQGSVNTWPSVQLTDLETGSPPNGDMGEKTSTGARYLAPAVQKTFDVMYILMRIPANQTHMQAVPSKRLMEQSQKTGVTQPNTIQQGNILLDGWGNPIIFVPRGGLHVNIKDPSTGTLNEYVVRSTGTFPAPGGKEPALTGSERPFFASAGQDGDFTQGEDNLYSFQE